jgi:hypothetical protein
MRMRDPLSRAAIALAMLLLPGCVGQLAETPGSPPDDGGVPDAALPPSMRTIELASEDPIALAVTCVDLAEGERLLDVGPEGDAWLATPAGARVLAPSGDPGDAIALRAGAPQRLVALSDTDALAFAAGHLFHVGSSGVAPIALPTELGAPELACGDPSTDRAPLFVVTPEGLHAREGGVWARWTLEGASLFAMGALGQESGACADASGELWLRDDEGALRVRQDATAAARVPELEGAIGLVREGATIAALRGPALVLRAGAGAAFETLRFDVGDVTAVALGGAHVWVIAGGELLRRTEDGAWARIAGDAPDAVAADETGGAWIASGARACRLASGAALRVRGLRPHEVVFGDRPIALESDAAGATLEVRVDGELVHEAAASDAAHRWQTPSLPLGAPGWHRLEALATIDGAEVRRAIDYHVVDDTPLSWDADIRPDFEAHCAACHAATGPRTNLASLETYRAFARTIRDRMALGEMPPTGPAVSPAVVDRMTRWIEGGMQP